MLHGKNLLHSKKEKRENSELSVWEYETYKQYQDLLQGLLEFSSCISMMGTWYKCGSDRAVDLSFDSPLSVR